MFQCVYPAPIWNIIVKGQIYEGRGLNLGQSFGTARSARSQPLEVNVPWNSQKISMLSLTKLPEKSIKTGYGS